MVYLLSFLFFFNFCYHKVILKRKNNHLHWFFFLNKISMWYSKNRWRNIDVLLENDLPFTQSSYRLHHLPIWLIYWIKLDKNIKYPYHVYILVVSEKLILFCCLIYTWPILIQKILNFNTMSQNNSKFYVHCLTCFSFQV